VRISTKGRYGLRVALELANRFGQGPVQMESIAQSQGLSRKYLHQLLTSLRSSELVQSVRGAAGGYALARPPAEVRVLEIVRALEGSLSLVDCVDNGSRCKRSETCVARDVWRDVSEAMERVLGGITLQDLIERQHRQAQAPLAFDI